MGVADGFGSWLCLGLRGVGAAMPCAKSVGENSSGYRAVANLSSFFGSSSIVVLIVIWSLFFCLASSSKVGVSSGIVANV
jgi:hypothetical protein